MADKGAKEPVPPDNPPDKRVRDFPRVEQPPEVEPAEGIPSRPSKRASKRGSQKVRLAGRRTVKEYPLDEAELNELAGLSALSSVAFAVATFALGFALDVSKDLALAPVNASETTFWGTLRGVAFVVAALGFFAGIYLVVRGHMRVGQIKRETDHE